MLLDGPTSNEGGHGSLSPGFKAGCFILPVDSISLEIVAVSHRRILTQLSSRRQRYHQNTESWKPELIVFDQYGTLIDIHSVWQPLVDRIRQRLELATGLDLQQKLYKTLDICRFTNKIRRGTLGEGTTCQIKRSLENMLHSEGLAWSEAQTLVEDNWENCGPAKPTDELKHTKAIFNELKSAGTKIGLCSADDRSTTVQNLRNSGLLHMIDHIKCGDDNAGRGVGEICESLGVSPCRTIVIGDAAADMKRGRLAGVAVNIGVLTGISSRLNLARLADVVTDDVSEAVGYVRTLNQAKVDELRQKRKVKVVGDKQASVVIFDKDGTLLCFHSLWTPWADKMINRLESATGLELAGKIFNELGYCTTERKWKPALFAEGTNEQCMERVASILEQEGIERSEAMSIITTVWPPGDHSQQNQSLKVLDNPASVFQTLRSLGIKVAVCTADSRHGTEQFLREHGAIDYVDMIVCGDDKDSVPKPDATNALRICEMLEADPERAVMVGDTSADMLMGRAAKLGATVAVLTGVGDVTHLAPDADYVVPSIGHVFEVVTSQADREYAINLYRRQLAKDKR
ncbi:hypothetical protein LSH36_69g04005 [Paralvinella palmiformis]|uniref:Phosphoglycolate phosphatase n=1 Tax=Paralvinella palmiformis TaxID=53620 RepID=A0AAD9K4P8_9ANNE|nr:hypothetical protein LSH36_69g04005 [Paralvinella palmiformis]